MTFLGIYRELEYSPGRHAGNDARILELVGQALERQGHAVRLVQLPEARQCWREAELIFSMAQGPDALRELAPWQAAGARIVNDPRAARRTYRDQLCASDRRAALHFPASRLLATDGTSLSDDTEALAARGAWLKRADVHAARAGDVVRVSSPAELPEALGRFARRGLARAVLQEHVEGEEVKFYGVRGARFFWPYYPADGVGYPFDERTLRARAEQAAASLGLDVYGGDAIVSPDGSLTLIDLNDWPSFAPCRGAAAGAIARYLHDVHADAHHRTVAGLR